MKMHVTVLMNKKNFTKKNEITRLIRDAFRENGPTLMTDEGAVKEFVDKIAEEYNLPAATLAFLVQKVNAFRLFNAFKEHKDVQTYPVIDLIDVREFCKQYGYEDIYDVIKTNIITKINEHKINKKSNLNIQNYGELRKAADLNPDIKITFQNDREKMVFNKFASSRLQEKLKEVTDSYWSNKGIEAFIKQADLDSDLHMKEVLDVIRSRKRDTVVKAATLGSFLSFKKEVEELKKDALLLGVLGDNSTSENTGEPV